jgi:chorismate mutase-like protein
MAGKPRPARKRTAAAKPGRAKTADERETPAKPDLTAVRTEIDGIDRQIQALIARRAYWAHEVGRAKGKLAATVDYCRAEREAQVLGRVVDRNEGPLADDVLVRLFREIMSACLAQQEPLKVGYLGPEGTFSEQAVFKHFGHSAKGFPLASIAEVFDEVAAGRADFGMVPVENSGQGTIQSTLDLFLGSPLKICGAVELHVHQYLLSRSGRDRGRERGARLRFADRRRTDRGSSRQHHALPGDRACAVPAVRQRPHLAAGVRARPARCAVPRARTAGAAWRQHEQDRVATGTYRLVAVRFLHRRRRPRRRIALA